MNYVLIEDKAEYTAFLSQHPDASFMQSWDWGEFQNMSGKKVFRFGIKNDSGEIIGTAQFLTNTVPFFAWQYLYCPRGPIGDQSIADSFLSSDFCTFLKTVAPNFSFVKVEPEQELSHQLANKSARVQPGKTLITDLTLPEPELLSNMRQKTRYNIKVAQKHGVEVALHQNSNSYNPSQIIDILIDTSGHHSYKNHSREYFTKLIEYFHGEGGTDSKLVVATAAIKDQLLATALLIDYGTTRTYLFGGSNYEHRALMAPYLMHWTAMLNAKNSGMGSYDWWGIETSSGKTPGFVRFKLGWGGREQQYPEAVELPLNKSAHLLYRASKQLQRLLNF